MNQYALYCFGVRSQAHTFHFQTESYAEHKALEGFYTQLLELFDALVETYQGSHGRIKISGKHDKLENYKDNALVQKHIKEFVKTTKGMKETIAESDSDLQNILDEMIALGNKTLYLLTLK